MPGGDLPTTMKRGPAPMGKLVAGRNLPSPLPNRMVGDFDGDGLDEIYIRSDGWAGVIKWQGDRFRLLWIRQNDLEYLRDPAPRLALAASDVFYAGRVLPNRAGVLHRASDKLCVLTWEGGQMKVRSQLDQIWNAWQVAPTDKFVIGDFHRIVRTVVGEGRPIACFAWSRGCL